MTYNETYRRFLYDCIPCSYHVTQIPSPEFDTKPQMQSEKFTVHISERGAKFDEKVEISEEKDAAYFKVPPHNGLSETDDMYDFKMVRNN